MAEDPKKSSKAGNRFGQPEKTSYARALMLFGVAVAGILFFVWMVSMAVPQKKLNCRTDIQPSLTGFGYCTEE